MTQFVAFVWDPADVGEAKSAKHLIAEWCERLDGWRLLVEQAGLAVSCSRARNGSEPQVLDDGAGIIIGDIWRKPAGYTPPETPYEMAPAVLTLDEERRIARHGGRELVTHFWGDYVAFLHDRDREATCVIRAPATLFPCLHLSHGRVDIYFSCTDELTRFLNVPLSIDWRYVVRSLIGPTPATATGIAEIRSIAGGVCEEMHHGSRTTHHFWQPIVYGASGPLNEFGGAASALRDVARYCAQARARRHDIALVSLSGGLDSSIVLACLRSASPARVVCLTQYAYGPDSDERHYARLAAQHVGCELLEFERTANIDLRKVLSPRLFERCTGFHTPDIDRIELDAARRLGASAVFKGHGGDELFCRHHTYLYVEDFLRESGLQKHFFELALDCAVREGETIWTCVGRAVGGALLPRRWSFARSMWRDQDGQSALDPECVAGFLAMAHEDHLLPGGGQGMPRGRLWQMSLLASWRPYAHPFRTADDAEIISPLLSQPVIETCLRIPTWLQMNGRRDRAVARAAFKDELPVEIIERRGKGGAEGLAWEMVQNNRGFLRDILLNGQLAQRGIVSKGRLEAALSDSPSADFRGTAPLLELLAMEAWLLSWRGRAIA